MQGSFTEPYVKRLSKYLIKTVKKELYQRRHSFPKQAIKFELFFLFVYLLNRVSQEMQ
jgi:hypothetical protein